MLSAEAAQNLVQDVLISFQIQRHRSDLNTDWPVLLVNDRLLHSIAYDVYLCCEASLVALIVRI